MYLLNNAFMWCQGNGNILKNWEVSHQLFKSHKYLYTTNRIVGVIYATMQTLFTVQSHIISVVFEIINWS